MKNFGTFIAGALVATLLIFTISGIIQHNRQFDKDVAQMGQRIESELKEIASIKKYYEQKSQMRDKEFRESLGNDENRIEWELHKKYMREVEKQK